MVPVVIVCCFSITLLLIGPVDSNFDDGKCDTGWKCKPFASCAIELLDSETVFPCSQFGAPIRVCCPPTRKDKGDEEESTTTSDEPANTTEPTPVTTSSTTTGSTTTSSTTTSSTTTISTTKTTIASTTQTTAAMKITNDTNTTTEKPHPATVWGKMPAPLREKLKLLPKDCGRVIIAERILNGEDANLGECPWMALIGYEDAGEKKFFCGGTLINKRYVLTAAHCSRVANFTPSLVRFGEWDLRKDPDCQIFQDKCADTADPVLDVKIEEFIVHGMYGNRSLPLLRFDIALIRLASDMTFTDFIQPICLPPKIYTESSKYSVSGWGVTDNISRQPSSILQFITVSLFDFFECNNIAPAEVSPLLPKTQFCAGGANGQDACKGDSGGPLTYNINNIEYQKGIVSLATSVKCGREGRPTVYTEVATFIPWILKNIKP